MRECAWGGVKTHPSYGSNSTWDIRILHYRLPDFFFLFYLVCNNFPALQMLSVTPGHKAIIIK